MDRHGQDRLPGWSTSEPPQQMRQCPTLEGEDRPLIAHCIATGQCVERQREFYHKCHRCIYRGKPADFALEPQHQNGVAKERPLRDEDRSIQ